MGQPKLASASMPRRVAPVAACVVAVLAAIVQASTDDCSGLTSSSTCLADEYCAWIVTLETDTYISSCTSCDSLATSEARCLENCAYYDADTEYCGPEPPTPAPTLSPLETTAPYVASEGLMVFNMDRASSISSSMQTSIEDAIVESLGANAVYLYSIESDSSCGEAPLCGDDPVMISSVSNWSAPVILPELSQCCPLEDTVTTDDCQTIDLSTGACRSVGLVEAFCEDVENGDSERCAALREPEAYNATLNLIVGFVEAGTESTCCKQCTCYGDPHCVSFNGTETSWRLCDGRDTRTEKECSITKFACKDRVDHTGKACKWKQDWSSNWHDGSPCQVDTNSDVSSITMYEADTFGFSITQRERGVIRSVNMTTANGTFYLSASACISGTDLDSWVWSDGDMSDAPSWTSSWSRVTTTSSFDVLWYIADGNTGIMAVIRCTGTRNPKKSNKYGNYRINVESLIEPDEFTERTNLGGFCYNDVLVDSSDKYALESYTEHLAIEAVCATIQPAWSEELALNYTSLLCGAGYTANSLDDCFVAFCNAYSFPNVDAEDCITLFANRELAEGFCSVTSSLESARSKCVNNINDFGYEDIITDYLSTASTSSNGTCANSTEELPTSLNDCQSGVTLQYEDEDGTWTDYLAIPESYPLCNGQLSISAISHPLLFTSAIRIVQCSNDGSCGTTTQCNAISGVDARFHFEVDYLLPTAAPVVGTPAPTNINPTPSPTIRGSTTAPVTTPGVTPSPTRSPTTPSPTSPTKAPTAQPTTRGKTNEPTFHPSGPTSPTTPSPTPSPSDSRNLTPSPSDSSTSSSQAPTASPTGDTYDSGDEENPYDSSEGTRSPTMEGETRSPSKRPTTLSPTVEGETRSPTTDDYGESPYDSQTYSPTVEGETRSPSKRPTTLSPTVEGETRSPTTDDYGESPYDSQTHSPTVEGETRSPTTDDYGESPYDSQTYSPTVEGETRSPTKRPTTLSPTVEGETRSPTESDDYTANEEAYDSHTPSPTTEESEWQYTEDEGYGYSILSQRTSAPNSGGRRRRQLYQKRFQYEAVNPSLLVNIPARPRTLIGNSLELRSGNSNRRKLDTTRPYNEVRVIFYALFEDNSDEESISSEVASSSSDFTSSIATELNAKSGFANVDVGYIGLSPTYKYGGLSFPIAYDSSKQSTSTFLSAVCKALAKTISKLTSLSNVNCGTKLLDFRAVEDSNGDLVVAFRMLNVKQGVIQKMLNTNKGQNVLKAQLAASDIDYVQVLSAAMPSYDEDEGASTGMIIGIAVGGGVGIAALFVGTALFIRRRRSQKPRLADDENLWNMVSYLADKNNKPISVTEAVGADADEKK